jgi:glycosyltransferase involved in cell wall biosynthesis
MTLSDKTIFLTAKDPEYDSGGDVTMTNLIMALARESRTVSCISLSTHRAMTERMTRVVKPPISGSRIALASLRRNHSLVHTRFDVQALVSAIEQSSATTYVAEHSYMAESFLRSRNRDSAKLVVNTHVSESAVWGQTRGFLGRVERPRIARDEYRVARAAAAVGTFDRSETRRYRDAGVDTARWLDLTLPPAEPKDCAATPPRLVFLGDQTWPPNAEGASRLLKLWPAISSGIPNAELFIVGKRVPAGHPRSSATNVTITGYVDDLPALLETCRAMIAPIRTGGGVRVKLLESASRGLPFIGTPEALGDHGDLLDLKPARTDQDLVSQARELLMSPQEAARQSASLYALNSQRWMDGIPHDAVTRWLDATETVRSEE